MLAETETKQSQERLKPTLIETQEHEVFYKCPKAVYSLKKILPHQRFYSKSRGFKFKKLRENDFDEKHQSNQKFKISATLIMSLT